MDDPTHDLVETLLSELRQLRADYEQQGEEDPSTIRIPKWMLGILVGLSLSLMAAATNTFLEVRTIQDTRITAQEVVQLMMTVNSRLQRLEQIHEEGGDL